ncbi:autotransporter domain-containing protein [Achromobacter xylosoxidans]|uniref:autotransporter family protein n=2 Tax=Alcaligenes xylosoxydans xylosoxydans TaxID=85698 RepID=UPI0006C118CD|nr:autotransporter domain-containing protein [Achromobacter xylosoxidans]CUJ47077.1 Extracellular serine protease precursor [Achromobacter xylosoxidans]CUJ76721.1 Extracellular serine protease precursor [Achromobacter xylosoxidans]
MDRASAVAFVRSLNTDHLSERLAGNPKGIFGPALNKDMITMKRTAQFPGFTFTTSRVLRSSRAIPAKLRQLTAALFACGIGGALLLNPLPASAIIIGPSGATIAVPDPASFGPGNIEFQGGTLEVTADSAFMPSYDDQQLLVGSAGGTLAVANGKTLELNTGIRVQDGVFRFGNAANAGTIVVGNLPWAQVSRTSEIHFDAGTVRNTAGTYGIGPLLYGAQTVSIAAGATLDLNGGSATFRNLQGAGQLEMGSGALSVMVLEGNFSGAIGGSRQLEKTGTGTLVLSGINTYTGGTRIDQGGVLSVSRDANLGNASGSVYINGETSKLQVTGTTFTQTGRSIQLGPLGGVIEIVDAANRLALTGAVSGTGSLAKTGAGTLVLANSGNSYRDTYVWGGTLEGSTETLRGDILNTATVVFDQHGDGTFAGNITGSGRIVKTGAGMLRLSNQNSAQQWKIQQGGVIFSANYIGLLPIEIDAGATMVYDTNDLGAYHGPLSGSGLFSKRGSGEVLLYGDSSAFAGHTRVEAGRLVVMREAFLGGTLEIANGATLEGQGTVGTTTIAAGGAVETGWQYRTLTVQGDLTMQPGSIFRVKAYPAPTSITSDRIVVRGTANLGGSVVHVGPAGNFSPAQVYTILTADRINGTFEQATSDYAYLDPTLGYTDKAVTLRLERRAGGFASAAQTGNQRNVAEALELLPDANPLRQYVLTLPIGAPAGVFDNLSGEAHASVVSSLAASGTGVRNVSFKHLRANMGAGLLPGAPTAQAGSDLPMSALPSSAARPAWAEVVGSWQTFNGDGNASRVTQNTGGVFVGADGAVGGGWRVGGALGFTDGRIKVDDRASKASVSGYTALLYGGRSVAAGAGKLNLLLGAAYTWNDIGTERQVVVAGAGQKLTADYGAGNSQLFTELGYAMAAGQRSQIEPFVGLAWSNLRTKGFTESGGSAALTGQKDSTTLTTSSLGLRGMTDFSLGKAEGRLVAAGGWRRAFGDLNPDARLAFDGGQVFTVAGTPIARNVGFGEVSLDLAVSRSASVTLAYSGQFGAGNRDHSGSLGVRWRY